MTDSDSEHKNTNCAVPAAAGAAASLAQTYTQLIWDQRLLQWRNYFENGAHDLSFLDNQFFILARHFLNPIELTPADRQSEILQMLIGRDLVDKNPAAAKLRNRLDNPDNYRDSSESTPDANRDVSAGASASASVDATDRTTDARRAMALKMRPDVLNLMHIRNGLAKDRGFYSYPELVLAIEELDRDHLINLLQEYLASNLPKAQHLIAKYNIRWESWFSDLERISPLTATAAAAAPEFDPIAAIDQFLALLELTAARRKIKINFQEHGLAGMASEVTPGDVRIMVAPVASLSGFKVLFHELGHALAYCFNQEQGLYRILPASYDEAMAVVIEHFAPRLLLDSDAQEKAAEIDVLEHTRCAISALFELELWESFTSKQPEDLYLEHYSRLGVRIDHPELWALDSFRSIDPVYIHNYVIGAVLAPRIYTCLLQNHGRDYRLWGQWLINNLYIDGRKRPFPAKVTDLCTL